MTAFAENKSAHSAGEGTVRRHCDKVKEVGAEEEPLEEREEGHERRKGSVNERILKMPRKKKKKKKKHVFFWVMLTASSEHQSCFHDSRCQKH